ncbi:MAG: glycoside hydrolase [Deltaproteobacteria bacterium]|nr:glycoside hydrolase [Deltaproteobacteria bacterium]
MPKFRREELGGAWALCAVDRFADAYDWARALTMDVPSHWQQHGDLAGYAGKVVYRREFVWKAAKDRRVRLVLPGIFYWSTVRLNGPVLGTHEGYFDPQAYDVTDVLAPRNELIVEVDCPDEKDKVGKKMITGVYSHWDCLDPTTNPGGIWLAPYLVESGFAHTAEALVHTEAFTGACARQRERVTIASARAARLIVEIEYTPANFRGDAHTFRETVDVAPGDNRFEWMHTVPEARKWWTHDLGFPHLYTLTIRLLAERGAVVDEWTDEIGLRTARFDNWIFHLNGERLFLKGSNVPPTDTRIATVQQATIDRDIELALGAHMNIQRVHAHVEPPATYRAADRAGLLLWQDMPLQWLYAREKMPEIHRQARAMVRLLYNHPSVAMWCCHNEPFHVVETKEENPVKLAPTVFSMIVYSWNRDVLDTETKREIEAIDPQRFVIRSSGELPLLGKGSDLHFYGGWYRVQGTHRAFDKFIRRFPKGMRLVSEFGAQSFPNVENAVRFMSADLHNLDLKTLEDRRSLQPELMDHWTPREGHRDLATYIQATQDWQSFIHRHYIDRLRAHKYAPCGGILNFMFSDPNPAIQWSVVDYWRTPKSSYFKLADCFRPIYVGALVDKDEYRRGERIAAPVFFVNDTRKAIDGAEVEAVVRDDENREIFRRTFAAWASADGPAVRVGEVETRAHVAGFVTLTLTLRGAGDEFVNVYRARVR